ncbi:CDP-alcohol phosphatidyltransferase family protein [Lentimicrobium sp.]|uniref:CDP-alcohol phosphatidyltransferase family protein n=1 Tax=Lentimicrobium sp. TaxID=2034841 RepID=UPI0025DB21EC|nr:CDP-alcohol phosphatidyltransferase family protein [Lentimicrobium sp.]MCO5258251.1 CDP-alcohol phosphatidyltransferase family protein [Lentimicrobium sp.]MCO5261480.1 CDP-alcohol phosphatidyltransferase family protein [Lentimicrobium sp.]HOP14231.1 CDP-alcohol phosphatidyltransferase family protein [Lentimicrobium sp.]HPF65939.1 CDP-alcohol phosphatidyltransferase family protein [Lentimicrobium sp.]HPJ63561.1 CDP-alcohol phosphatidyltransferase family protein [Lentimicrobium sp.]
MKKNRPVLSQVPNMVTLLNLLSGSVSVIMVLSGETLLAAMLVGLAAIFDFFDGFLARLLKVKSDIGKELDSLADVISFGLVPALFLFMMLRNNPGLEETAGVGDMIPYFALLTGAFSAYRLAFFNLDTRQTESFRGLPTPANAIFIVSLSLIAGETPLFDAGVISSFAGNLWVQLLLIPLSCWLLVSDIPMFALKFSKGFGFSQNRIRYLFLLLSLLLLVFFRFGGIPLIIVMYVMISLFTEGEKN